MELEQLQYGINAKENNVYLITWKRKKSCHSKNVNRKDRLKVSDIMILRFVRTLRFLWLGKFCDEIAYVFKTVIDHDSLPLLTPFLPPPHIYIFPFKQCLWYYLFIFSFSWIFLSSSYTCVSNVCVYIYICLLYIIYNYTFVYMYV